MQISDSTTEPALACRLEMVWRERERGARDKEGYEKLKDEEMDGLSFW